MSRIIEFKIVLFSLLVVTIITVQCTTSDHQKGRETNTNVGENLIVSIINNIIKLKDNDIFKTGIEASVRSVFSKPITSAVYALSVLAGVVAMLAFYESPVSPMPVPPLPDPPVGRFPPEHPIWPPPQRDAVPISEKKRVGIMNNNFMSGNSHMPSQMVFPQINSNQKYSEMDPSSYNGAYQQLLNVIENRNSKSGVKHNRVNSNSVAESSPQVYSSFTVESDPKVLNDSIKLQSLYPEVPTDRIDSMDNIKLYNQNHLSKHFDKIREYNNNVKKTSNPEVIKELKDKFIDKFNFTSIINDSNRKVKP